MSTNAEQALDLLKKLEGTEEGTGEWFQVEQERINDFARVTIDDQYIHTDPERAKDTPFGTTIAHGFLTLSLVSYLTQSIPRDPAAFQGMVMGINYGFDKVRFVAPVKVNSRIRARSEIASASLKDPNTVQITRKVTLEIEGEDKPACVADWLTLIVYG
ncbi:MAG: MaoC family dehydratase [Actinobacteria bacterium]|nr:MaoC family dehydratase [Actinomycetota bacterium]